MEIASLVGDLADVSQALAAPLVALTLLYAGRQVRELRRQVAEEVKTRRLQATRDFLDLIAADEVRAIRRWLLDMREEDYRPHRLSDEDRSRILRLAVAYDRVGLMVEHQLIDQELIYEWQGEEILRLWSLAMPVVATERAKRGRAAYCKYFDQLAAVFERLARDGGGSDGRRPEA